MTPPAPPDITYIREDIVAEEQEVLRSQIRELREQVANGELRENALFNRLRAAQVNHRASANALDRLREQHAALSTYHDQVCRECDDLRNHEPGIWTQSRAEMQAEIDRLKEEVRERGLRNVRMNLEVGDAQRQLAEARRELAARPQVPNLFELRNLIQQAFKDTYTKTWPAYGKAYAFGAGAGRAARDILAVLDQA